MDSVSDCSADGRVIRFLAIVDDATGELTGPRPERAIGGLMVTRLLDELTLTRGLPKVHAHGCKYRVWFCLCRTLRIRSASLA